MKWSPNPEQHRILTALHAECAKEESQTAFAREYLPFGASTLSKIFNALDADSSESYFDKIDDPDAKMEELAGIVEEIPAKRALKARMNRDGVLALSQFRAMAGAVRECQAKTNDPERLIKYLAPTGGGKSMLCTYLMKKCGAKIVESRDAWKKSYFTVLQDLARAIGCRIGDETRPSVIEDQLIEMQRKVNTVLVVDEAEFFGAQAINGFKLLLNKTRLVPIICAIPEAHDRWNRYFPMEAQQLARRTHAVFELRAVNPKDAEMFFAENAFKDAESALAMILGEANQFGHYSLIQRVASRLKGVSRNTEEDVRKAIQSSLKAMRKTPRTAEVMKEGGEK